MRFCLKNLWQYLPDAAAAFCLLKASFLLPVPIAVLPMHAKLSLPAAAILLCLQAIFCEAAAVAARFACEPFSLIHIGQHHSLHHSAHHTPHRPHTHTHVFFCFHLCLFNFSKFSLRFLATFCWLQKRRPRPLQMLCVSQILNGVATA